MESFRFLGMPIEGVVVLLVSTVLERSHFELLVYTVLLMVLLMLLVILTSDEMECSSNDIGKHF